VEVGIKIIFNICCDTEGLTDLMAKHAENNLGKILSTCVFKDKVLLMCNPPPPDFISFTFEI
jgi:hypothetical protein